MLRAIALYALVAVGVPLSLFQPFSGLLLYLFFAHAHPADFVWPGYIFNYGLFLAPSLIVGYILFDMRKSPPRIKGMMLLLVFWAWLTAAAFLARDTHLAFDMLERYSKMFVIAFLIAAMANTEERIRKILLVLAGCLGILGLKSLLSVIVTAGQYRVRGPGGLLTEENEYALAMNMAIPILYWLASVETGKWLRRGMRAAAIACGIVVIFTRSRSGFLGLIVVCLLMALYSRRKLLGIAGLAVLVCLFVMFGPEASKERYETISTATQQDESAIGRIQAWETAIDMAKAHPFFGVGLRNFEITFNEYTDYEARAPHNAFMALMAEAGIPACLLFAAIVLSASGSCWMWFRRLRYDPSTHTLAIYALIVHATLLVYLVPNLFINRQDLDLMYHLIGLSSGLTLVMQKAWLRQRASVPDEMQEFVAATPEGLQAVHQ